MKIDHENELANYGITHRKSYKYLLPANYRNHHKNTASPELYPIVTITRLQLAALNQIGTVWACIFITYVYEMFVDLA